MTEQKTHTTLFEIAEALGISKNGAEKRARRQGWPYIEEPAKGGLRRWYPIASLPRVIARQLQAKKAIRAMKIISAAKKEKMPDAFMAVLDAEVYEIRRVQS